MKNIPGWFPPTNQETLEMLIKKHNVKTVLEIGAFVGLSTVWFAERVEHVVTIDPFDAITRIDYLNADMKRVAEKQWENFLENTKEYRGSIMPYQMTSEQAYNHIPKLTADLIYIDGSHHYEDVKKDIEMWYPRATIVLCGDDYTDAWPGVRQAVDEHAKSITINTNQRCWYTEKL
jgi:cephalosporin hydroxylase